MDDTKHDAMMTVDPDLIAAVSERSPTRYTAVFVEDQAGSIEVQSDRDVVPVRLREVDSVSAHRILQEHWNRCAENGALACARSIIWMEVPAGTPNAATEIVHLLDPDFPGLGDVKPEPRHFVRVDSFRPVPAR